MKIKERNTSTTIPNTRPLSVLKVLPTLLMKPTDVLLIGANARRGASVHIYAATCATWYIVSRMNSSRAPALMVPLLLKVVPS